VEELVALCHRYGLDAQWHLIEGRFESRLRSAGQGELAENAAVAKQLYPNSEHALLFRLNRCGPEGETVVERVRAARHPDRAQLQGGPPAPPNDPGAALVPAPKKDLSGSVIGWGVAGVVLGLVLGEVGAALAAQTEGQRGMGACSIRWGRSAAA